MPGMWPASGEITADTPPSDEWITAPAVIHAGSLRVHSLTHKREMGACMICQT